MNRMKSARNTPKKAGRRGAGAGYTLHKNSSHHFFRKSNEALGVFIHPYSAMDKLANVNESNDMS